MKKFLAFACRYWRGLMSFVLVGAGAGVLIWWCSSYSTWIIRNHLKAVSPLFLEIIFLLITVTALVNLYVFLKKRREREDDSSGNVNGTRLINAVRSPGTLMLGAIMLAGLVMLLFVVPREHRIFYDEQIYQNIAQNIAMTKGEGSFKHEDFSQSIDNFWKRFTGRAGMCNEGRNQYGEYTCYRLEYNKEPNGWAYLLSLVFRVFGVSTAATFYTNTFLFLLSVLCVYFLTHGLFHDKRSGLYAALVFTLTPEVLIWYNTVAAEPSAAFFAALAVLSVLYFVKEQSTPALVLAALVCAFGIQFRPESAMICCVAGLAIIVYSPKELLTGRFYLTGALFFLLIIPHLAHLWAVREMGWGSSGPKFALEHFPENFRVNALFYIKNMRFPALFTLLFFGGLFLKNPVRNRFCIRPKIILLIWFLLFWGIFLFFYAGSYNYGADVRFSVLSAVPVAVLAGFGAAAISGYLRRKWYCAPAVLTAVMIVWFLSFMPFLRAITEEAWAARADTRYAEKMAEVVPDDAVILTHNPNMFLVWGKNAAQASLATEHRRYFRHFFNKYKGGVYFHYNFWCNVSDPLQNSFCENILKRYEHTEIMSFKERDYSYRLYRLEGPAKRGR